MVAECRDGPAIRGHGMVGEEAQRYRPQSESLFGDWLMRPSAQFVLHPLKRRPHAVAAGLPLQLRATRSCLPADERKTRKGKSLRLLETATPL